MSRPMDYRYTQDRELSWLKFNERVLAEARDESVPLMERLKFAAIFTSNLDEFFMVRVGSITDMALVKEEHVDLSLIHISLPASPPRSTTPSSRRHRTAEPCFSSPASS